jgi:cystathionine beta-lyase/cystathionine gamma-synthase
MSGGVGGAQRVKSAAPYPDRPLSDGRPLLELGITDELVRVSCGIEHADDLIEDFRRALEQA